MTDTEIEERLQVAQDIIDTVTQQRDGAHNAIAQLNARVKQLERRLAMTEAKLHAVPDTTAPVEDSVNSATQH